MKVFLNFSQRTELNDAIHTMSQIHSLIFQKQSSVVCKLPNDMLSYKEFCPSYILKFLPQVPRRIEQKI